VGRVAQKCDRCHSTTGVKEVKEPKGWSLCAKCRKKWKKVPV
jgi:hypothetical protein